MKAYKADLHIHTCLSPCGDLDMSPRNIVARSIEIGLDVIAICDHNSTRNVKPCMELGAKNSLFVIGGCEINTSEEVHCLTLFPDLDSTEAFQVYLDKHLPDIKNEPSLFGYQVAVDQFDNIIYEEEKSLYGALDMDIESIAQVVKDMGGIFIPAHINREKNSVFSQLGFIPFDLEYDALEIFWATNREEFLIEHPELEEKTLIQNSDAHYLENIGRRYTQLKLEDLSWEAIKNVFENPIAEDERLIF